MKKDKFEFAEWIGLNQYVFIPNGEWFVSTGYGSWDRIAKTTDELYFEFLKEKEE